MAALGRLYLDRGRWGGRRLLSEEWVELATTAHVETAMPDPGWAQGYGFRIWLGLEVAFRADGAYGQFAVVHPPTGIVVAVTATSDRTSDILAGVRALLRRAVGQAGSVSR